MPRRRKTEALSESPQTSAVYERLSPATENYLLCLYKLWEETGEPTVTELTETLKGLPPTEGLGTSVPSVAGMIRRMEKQGLVDVGADKRIRMTKKGMEGGEDIARRHRLVEWMVVKILGMEPHQAHIEAHRLEHGVSPQLEERLFELLGQPTKSPFGRPIPGTGEPKTPPNSISLDRAATKEAYVVERIPEEDPNLLRFLVDSQVVPDSNIEVADAAPYLGVLTVETGTGRVSVGYNVAQQILVRLKESDAPMEGVLTSG
jgi:DtxR family Mn-dependent transcriptional regulator